MCACASNVVFTIGVGFDQFTAYGDTDGTNCDCDLKLELTRHNFMSYVCCTSFDCVSSAFGARTCGNGWRCGEWK